MVAAPSFDSLVEEAAATPAGAEGLIALPYFGGARSPLFDPGARGVIAGLNLSHGRGHLFRALLEGSAFEVRHNLEVMEEAGATARRLIAVGGGTKSSIWAQIVTDVTGYPQVIPAQTIGACYGDALLAARGTGLVPSSATWDQAAIILEPNPSLRGRYDELFAVFRSLYEASREAVHQLSAIQNRDAG